MALRSVSAAQLDLAQASYARCQLAPEFFRSFYDRFLASDPAIPSFSLRRGLTGRTSCCSMAFPSSSSMPGAPNPGLLDRIAERHGAAGGLAVPARLFSPFLESFLATVQEFDPDASAETEAAWRAALAPGIEYVMSPGP